MKTIANKMKYCLDVVNGLETQISNHAPTQPTVAHADLALQNRLVNLNVCIKNADFMRIKVLKYALSTGISVVT